MKAKAARLQEEVTALQPSILSLQLPASTSYHGGGTAAPGTKDSAVLASRTTAVRVPCPLRRVCSHYYFPSRAEASPAAIRTGPNDGSKKARRAKRGQQNGQSRSTAKKTKLQAGLLLRDMRGGMAGMDDRSGGVVPWTFEQIFELLESTNLRSPAALLCQVEGLLLRGTGATSVDGFLVDRWFNKLLHFVAVDEGDSENEEAGGSGEEGHKGGGADGRSQSQQHRKAVFDTEAECNIGDGVLGVAAMTGRKLRVRDCRTKQGWRPENPAYSTRHASGSLVCWPVQRRTHHTEAAPAKEPHPVAQLEDVEVDADCKDEPPGAMESTPGVLAVLQLYCAEGELSPEALEILQSVGRLLAPLLEEAQDHTEEIVRRRSAEALLSLSRIVPRQVGLITMIDEIVRLTKRLTGAESVSFFFVDHEAHELWAAESANLGEERFKIGEGICGHAAATGGTVNVIDSYSDERFDRRWDDRPGSVAKSVLCVPIPPPDHTYSLRKAGAAPSRKACGTESRVPVDAFSSQQGVPPSSSSSSSTMKGHEHQASESVGRAGQPTPRGSRHQSSKTPARPLAVLKVADKRSKGIFNEHEEHALVRLCAGVESLLRSKAAEVSLLCSGMTERSLIRNSNHRGGAGGAWSNHARVESTIMRLYSEASFPADAVSLRRRYSTRSVVEGRLRALSDSINDSFVDLAKKNGGSPEGNAYGSGCGTPAVDDNVGRVHPTLSEEWKLLDLSMSLFEVGSEQLLSLVARFFRNMELTDIFQISEQKMWNFVRAVDERYQPNAFHNIIHAVSVTHVSFTIVKTTEISSLLRPLDKLALLVAAFCHDIDHPGNNNAYEVNSVSPLALQYADSSVLERHHVFVTYQVLLHEGGGNNIFSGLSRAQFRDARHTIVQAILDQRTDLSSPRPFFTGACTRLPASSHFDCDVLDRPLALEWGRRILEEFRLQARLEANTGLPRTTVASGDMETTIKGQHFFAVKIVKPLWEPFVALFPKLKPLLESLNGNCEYYRQEGLRLERMRLSATPDSSSPRREDREGHDNKGSDGSGNNGGSGGGGGACGDDDQVDPPRRNGRRL
eukprot:g15744.t2